MFFFIYRLTGYDTVSSGALHPAPYPEMEDGDVCMCSNGAPYTGLHFGGRREVPHG